MRLKYMKAFAKEFKKRKKETRLTYAEISRAVEIPQPYLCDIANGKRNTSLENGMRISRIMGFSIDNLKK